MRTRLPYSYEKVHEMLKQQRGPARDHVCRCGEPAVDWAYQFTGEELRAPDGSHPHSADPADYAPMCRSCHVRLDWENGVATEERREQMRRLSESNSKQRRRCLQCGLVGAPGAIGTHQRHYRHTGLENVAMDVNSGKTD